MAHDQYSELLADDTGRAINQIILSLLGGVLLLVSLIARFTFEQPFFSALVAFLASLMLGVPLVIQAFKDLRDGRAEMNELVALGVVAPAIVEKRSTGALTVLLSLPFSRWVVVLGTLIGRLVVITTSALAAIVIRAWRTT